MKKKLEEIVKEMYHLNASISLHNIGMKKPITYEEIRVINRRMGDWIKRIRLLVDSLNSEEVKP